MTRRAGLCLLALLLLLPLSGCGGGNGGMLRYDLAAPVTNLDPQFATGPEAGMILANLYEGLVRQTPEGAIQPACATGWEISPDGKTYTFTLREGLSWSDGSPLTAGDFVAAFRRLFSPGMPSPYSGDFLAIQNAGEMLSGQPGELGVRAGDSRTLIFTLERPDPLFLQLLATPAALPCSMDFFNSCRGRYGLEAGFVLSNGPFTLTGWDADGLTLRRRENDYPSTGEAAVPGVRFYTGRGDALTLLDDGKSDAARIPYSYRETALSRNMSVHPVAGDTWMLAFNLDDPVWRSPLLRQGLARAADRAALAAVLPEGLSATERFAPDALLLGEQPFGSYGEAGSPIPYDEEAARRLFGLGMEQLELPAEPQLMILLPDTDEHMRYVQALQQGWQRTLSVYPRLQRFSMETLQKRYATGDFQAILLPLAPGSAQAGDFFPLFRSGAAGNRTGYRNPLYDSFLEDARTAPDLAAMARRLNQAQRLLLSDAPVIPLYRETALYACAEGVSGIGIYPFGEKLTFFGS